MILKAGKSRELASTSNMPNGISTTSVVTDALDVFRYIGTYVVSLGENAHPGEGNYPSPLTSPSTPKESGSHVLVDTMEYEVCQRWNKLPIFSMMYLTVEHGVSDPFNMNRGCHFSNLPEKYNTPDSLKHARWKAPRASNFKFLPGSLYTTFTVVLENTRESL